MIIKLITSGPRFAPTERFMIPNPVFEGEEGTGTGTPDTQSGTPDAQFSQDVFEQVGFDPEQEGGDNLADPSKDKDPDKDKDPSKDEPVQVSADDIFQSTRSSTLQFDDEQNVVDKDGNIIAKAGGERRLFQRAHDAESNLTLAQQENQQLKELVGQAKAHIEAMNTQLQSTDSTKLGLTVEETGKALQMAADFKTKPVEALKSLLTQMAQNGINLEELGIQQGSGLDAKTLSDNIVSQVNTALAPIKEQFDAQAERNKITQESGQEVRLFLQQNPDAVPYVPQISEMLNDPRAANMSLTEVWLRLKLHLQSTQSSSVTNSPTGRSMPNGQGTPGIVEGNVQIDNSPVDPNTDYADILRGVFGDFKVQL